MIRKISTKPQTTEEKTKKQNLYMNDNEYYLIQPNPKILKTENKDN